MRYLFFIYSLSPDKNYIQFIVQFRGSNNAKNISIYTQILYYVLMT